MDSFTRRIGTVIFIVVVVTFADVFGVHINDLKVPPIIRNGTEEYVILDCDYSLEENEKAGLVVKWYFNNEESPVYQWIPNQKPQDLGILRGKLNLDYKVSDDAYTMYRALQIYKPNTDLGGKYLCRVSTLYNDAYKSGTMVVYSPQKEMGVKVSPAKIPGYVNVSCWASGVYPEPRLSLFYGDNSDQKVEDLFIQTRWNQNSFDIHGYKVLKETNLSSITSLFDCELRIPSADYVIRKTTLYEPGSLELRHGYGGTVSLSCDLYGASLITLASLLLSLNIILGR